MPSGRDLLILSFRSTELEPPYDIGSLLESLPKPASPPSPHCLCIAMFLITARSSRDAASETLLANSSFEANR